MQNLTKNGMCQSVTSFLANSRRLPRPMAYENL